MSTEAEVEALLERLVGAWNRRDASCFAGLFTEDAEYVTGGGGWTRGRPAIERLVRDTAPGGRVAIERPASFRVGCEMATAVFQWSAPGSGGGRSRGVATCVVTRQDDRWLIDRLHNTDEADDGTVVASRRRDKMGRRIYLSICGVLFLIVAAAHLTRLSLAWDLQIEGWSPPRWLSLPGMVFAGLLSIWGFALASRIGRDGGPRPSSMSEPPGV